MDQVSKLSINERSEPQFGFNCNMTVRNCNGTQPFAQATVVRGKGETFGGSMPKKRKHKYSPSAGRDVESEMRRYKRGTARSGRGGKGGKVKSRKQAIAIGLSKARKEGKRVPRKRA
jgi:hypothetical protein